MTYCKSLKKWRGNFVNLIWFTIYIEFINFFSKVWFIWNVTISTTGLGYLTPLSTKFQLYRGGHFYWWRKPEYPEKTIDLPNRQNSEPLASFSGLFRSEYKWIVYLTTMYVYCVYPAMSKKSENLSDLNKKDRNKCHSS
jgi:hypothetical protein